MKRTIVVLAFFAMGLLMANSFAAAQDAPATTSGGQVVFGALGVKDISSAKFQEYREIPKGLSIPFANIFSTSSTLDFNLLAYNVRQTDQRYTGWANFSALGVSFDYNQTPHNMGNNGHVFMTETAPGVWSMSGTLRQYLGDTIDNTASTSRNYPFYLSLFTPTLNAANSVDIIAMRKRGTVEVDLGKKLPFDLKFTYMREAKTGNRGPSSGTLYGLLSTTLEVPDAMNEVVQDFGVRAEYGFKGGNVHASFNRNLYRDQQASLIIDNPFRATDYVYSSSAIPSGGSARFLFSTPPDNEASRAAFGVLIKLALQTRLAGDVAIGTMTQNSQFYPYTINSTILTGTGAPASLTSSLQRQSLNGKANTTVLNLSATSRPVDGLGIRVRYRSYDYKDKSGRFLILGDTSASPDRAWGAAGAATVDEPYGHATANSTSWNTGRFDGQVSYDFKPLTVEAGYRNSKSSYVGRNFWAGTDNKENGFTLGAVLHAADWLGIRGTFDQGKRTVSGVEQTTTVASGLLTGVQADHAERKQTRTGIDIELEPVTNLGLTFAYYRRNDEYPNRPMKIAGDSATTSGLISAKYDTYTVEFDYSIPERAEFSAFYTYEKNLQSNRWMTLTGTPSVINLRLQFDGSDKGNSYGANAVIHLVPEKWTFTLNAVNQKVDGNMAISGLTQAPTPSTFITGRTALGGIQPITDWDDTQITTLVSQLDYAVAKNWKISAGYAYEKYTFADAYSSTTANYVQVTNFFMKPDNGGYNASVVFAKLGYKF
jgi:hypothetical protein